MVTGFRCSLTLASKSASEFKSLLMQESTYALIHLCRNPLFEINQKRFSVIWANMIFSLIQYSIITMQHNTNSYHGSLSSELVLWSNSNMTLSEKEVALYNDETVPRGVISGVCDNRFPWRIMTRRGEISHFSARTNTELNLK